MADDKNKPNQSNKPVNGKLPKHIEEALRTHEYATSYEHLSSKDEYKALEEKLAKLEADRAQATSGTQQYQDVLENIAMAETDLAQIDKVYHDKQNEQLANTVAAYTRTRNINERTTTKAGRQRFFKQARTSQDVYLPTEVIESRIQQGIDQVNAIGTEIAGRARGLGTEEVPESLKGKATQITQIEEEIAFNKRLLKVQSKQGLSTEKMFGRTEEVMGRTERYFEDQGLKERVARGDVQDIGEETKQLGLRQRDVHVAQEQYDKAMESGAENVSDFVKALKNATDALDKQQKLVTEMNRQGVSGPGGGGISWGDVGAIAALAGRAVGTVARGQRMMWVDQQREEMSNKAQFAARANRIYGQAENAIMGGDIDAMLELTSGALNFAKDESDFAKTFTNVSEGVAQVGDAAVGVGNTITATTGGLKAGLGFGSTATGTVAGVAQGAIETSNAAVRAGRLARGGYGAAQSLPSYDVSLQLQKQMRAMDSKMFQAVYDQGMTTYNSVSGLGGAGNIQSQLMNTDTLGRMAGVGLTPEKAAQLTAGMRAAGAMSAQDAMHVVEGAGGAKRRGILGQEEYVGMAAQLMGAGGAGGDLESIMSAAVAAGMDNSKSIGELVSGTLALSQGLGAMGIAATGSSQDLLAKASQNLVNSGVDPNLATNAAMQSLQNYQNFQGSNAFDLGNIVERSGLRQINSNFTNANVAQMDQLQKMTAAEHKILMQGARANGDSPQDKEARARADQLLKQKGLTEILNPNGAGVDEDVVKRMVSLSNVGASVNMGGLGQKGIDPMIIAKKLAAGEELTDKETALFANQGITAQTIGAAVKLDDPATTDPNTKKKLTGAGAEETQARFKLKELQDAEGKGPGNIQDVFKTLEATLAGIQENIGPEKMSEEVQRAAKEFEAPTLTFKEGTKEFKEAVDKFVKHQNAIMANIGENQAKPSTDTLKQNKDNGSYKKPTARW